MTVDHGGKPTDAYGLVNAFTPAATMDIVLVETVSDMDRFAELRLYPL